MTAHAEIDDLPLFSDVCNYCTNFISNNVASPILRKCRAFPEGIPREIWRGDNDHDEPFKGDHGIQFEFAEPLETEKEVGRIPKESN